MKNETIFDFSNELKKLICFKKSFAIYDLVILILILIFLLGRKLLNLRRTNNG